MLMGKLNFHGYLISRFKVGLRPNQGWPVRSPATKNQQVFTFSQYNYNCRYTNALSVLQDWLECNTTGPQSKFNLVANLENSVVSCQRMQLTTIKDFFNHSDQSCQPWPLTQKHRGRGQGRKCACRSPQTGRVHDVIKHLFSE